MTSDQSSDGPPGGRPQPNRSPRRADQGDLWDNPDDAPEDRAAPPPRPPRQAARRAPPTGASAAAAGETRVAGQPVRPAQPAVPDQTAMAPLPGMVPYDDEEDEEDYYDDEEPSLLGNPYVLAAGAVAAAIILAVVVVFLFGRGDGESGVAGTTANATRTPTATVDAPQTIGLAARSIAIATVREGPALSHVELGLLQANQDVDVTGRNEDASWFQIVFPPGTELRGWVPNSALRLPDDVETLVSVTEATPVPRPEVPTETPVPAETPSPTPEDEDEDEGPDLAVAIISSCAPGSEIAIQITNAGDEALEAELIEVIISNNSAVLYRQPFQADMAAGASANLNTGVEARPPEMTVLVRFSELDDVDMSNNASSCPVQSAAPNSNDNSSGNLPPPIATQNTP